MKSNLLIILMSLLAINLIGQECKYEKNEVDLFTGETLKYSKDKSFYLNLHGEGLYGQFRFTKSKGQENLTFNLSFKTSEEWANGFKVGQKLYFKLENDSLIQLTGKLEKEKMYHSNYILKSGWLIDNEYILTKEQLNLLKKSLIKQLRLYYFNYNTNSEEYVEFDGINLNPEVILKLANCID